MLGSLIPRRSQPALSWPDYQSLFEMFGFNGVQYMQPSGTLTQLTALQSIRNPIVLQCIIMRASCFAEISFQYQDKATGKLYGNQGLAILEEPFPGGSTGDLLARMELDASMYGNSYWWKSAPDTLTWLDPTKMKIITGSVKGPESGQKVGEILLGYQTQDKRGQPEETFLRGEIAHYRPMPDPDHPFRGLSWLSALLPDVSTDQDITDFKRGFLRNSATPNLIVQHQRELSDDAFKAFKERMEAGHTGASQAFKTLYLGPGADVKTVGSNWSDMELFATQSYGDTRLCVAAGVPASLVGIAEGLKGSALNAGNYTATRRRFADITVRPLWRMGCSALKVLAPPPKGSRLWYSDRGVQFLQADLQDAAAVRTADAATVSSLINAGFDPDSVVLAVTTGDFSGLKHSGLISVQLQPTPKPGDAPTPDPEPADDSTEPAAA